MLGRAEGEKVTCDVADHSVQFVICVYFDGDGTLPLCVPVVAHRRTPVYAPELVQAILSNSLTATVTSSFT